MAVLVIAGIQAATSIVGPASFRLGDHDCGPPRPRRRGPAWVAGVGKLATGALAAYAVVLGLSAAVLYSIA